MDETNSSRVSDGNLLEAKLQIDFQQALALTGGL
jgi:hypothetical protein